MAQRIVFVARSLRSDWPDIGALDEPALAREHARFRRGIENWIVQSYVRLRVPLERAGFEVRISDRFERGAICVAHRDDLNRYSDPLHDCYVVGVRADRPRVAVAQVEVVQNPLQLESAEARLIQHWPQPGLLPRDPARGQRLERAVYCGRENSVPAWYRDASFHDALAARGIALEIRDRGWNDYRAADVVIAHRDETSVMLANKPASKLVNAWLAGVPAVLAPEPAFVALRHSPLDFVATTDARTTVEALGALSRDPVRYRAMVENGLRRGRNYDVEALRSKWLDLLINEVAPDFSRQRTEARSSAMRRVRFLLALSRQTIEARRFRARQQLEQRELASR